MYSEVLLEEKLKNYELSLKHLWINVYIVNNISTGNPSELLIKLNFIPINPKLVQEKLESRVKFFKLWERPYWKYFPKILKLDILITKFKKNNFVLQIFHD